MTHLPLSTNTTTILWALNHHCLWQLFSTFSCQRNLKTIFSLGEPLQKKCLYLQCISFFNPSFPRNLVEKSRLDFRSPLWAFLIYTSSQYYVIYQVTHSRHCRVMQNSFEFSLVESGLSEVLLSLVCWSQRSSVYCIHVRMWFV